MRVPAATPGVRPRLYHAPSSYYSMIARLALAEAAVDHEPVYLDILLRMSQQRPDYVRLNHNMTVPTLVLPDRILDQSRAIAEYALGAGATTVDVETRAWLDRHYAFPIEQLTFGGILAHNPVARRMIPRRLAAAHRRLLRRAAAHVDLAELYRARAAVFAERIRIFDPEAVIGLAEQCRAEAIGLMDVLAQTLGDGRAVIVPPAYGVADVVWTVFLARMAFVGLAGEIDRRPALLRYWRAMQARPSFAAADIWTRLHKLRLIAGMLGIIKG